MEPLPYQLEITNLLSSEMADLWNWFEQHRLGKAFSANVRQEVEKYAFRVSKDLDESLYELVELAALELGITSPVSIFQGPNSKSPNAAIAFSPDEVCLVFQGGVTQLLTNDELMALASHELGHHVLWTQQGQKYFVADQILSALSADATASSSQRETYRRWQLYSEIYCDRVALRVVGDPKVVVSMLVKVTTGVPQVDAARYLQQADSVADRELQGSNQSSHPEAYIRARALRLWIDEPPQANSKIVTMLEGKLELDSLDLLEQKQLSQVTRMLVDHLLQPTWFQTEATLAHARTYFADFVPMIQPAGGQASQDQALSWGHQVARFGTSLQDYLCYVLLDFVNSDRDLEDRPLARALTISEQLNIKERFLDLSKRELRLRKRQLDAIVQSQSSLISDAKAI